ncbi:phosphotransferase [Roseomonas sp. E05]|uniref:phosphotransferase n=1 Tax=Roseomonas sp. E05 TaxID=3046310 RepID=UPI0024BB1DB6|nr:phosphotransferase [Roseomonas sp. E05]MDJ0386842.1 phosphotransferase [Roseomonas sp. E05]
MRFAGEGAARASLEHKPLHGGIEAASVLLVTARYRDEAGRPVMRRFVVKHLRGRAAREGAIYETLLPHHAARLAPRLLGRLPLDADGSLLFIEAIRRAEAWPWRDLALGNDLLQRLAALHAAGPQAAQAMPPWDYAAELQAMAEATYAALDACRLHPELAVLARERRTVGRIVLGLPALRGSLLAEQPFGTRLLHGDMHAGNALACRRGRGVEPVLIDWGRARLGSPFEDVSSWLQSLRCWEPQVQRFHDSLLKAYLAGLGLPQRLTSQVRAAYWVAAASNALAGALLHHLHLARDPRQGTARRAEAFRAARDWLRVLRRAAAWAC